MPNFNYIGRNGRFLGKSLPQICLKLKDFGIGRMFVRETYKRYPEISYYILTRIEADMNDEYLRRGEFFGKVVFRGTDYGNVPLPGYKEDFQLVPKHMEKIYLDKTLSAGQKWREPTVVPKFIDLPPLMKEMLIQEVTTKKLDIKLEELKLPFIVKEDYFSNCKYE